MGLIPKFKPADVKRYIQNKRIGHRQVVIDILKSAGELFVQNARANGEYENHTYNLVSSLAFAVVDHGRIIHDDYQQIGSGSEGVEKAKALISELSIRYNKGFTLIGVVGEDYAVKVESLGKDVVTGSSQKAMRQLKAAIRKI